MTRRAALPVVLAVVAICAPSLARAQESQAHAPFGARAANVLVVDELVGIYRETIAFPDRSNGAGDESGLLYVGSSAGVFALNQTTRFGYHRFITPEISIGAGLHYADRDVALEAGGKETLWGISPRLGFVLAPSEVGALWLRFGFQYYHYSLEQDATRWGFGPGVELFYVFTPIEHFGISIGPTIEIDVAGNEHVPSPTPAVPSHDEAVRRRTYGLALGFLFDL